MFTISIIDDNNEILELLKMLLESKYKVYSFNCIDNALKDFSIIKKSNILILDYSINGIVCDEILERMPHNRVIVMSGYSKDSPFINKMLLQYNVNFIKKPFSLETILSLIKKLLPES